MIKTELGLLGVKMSDSESVIRIQAPFLRARGEASLWQQYRQENQGPMHGAACGEFRHSKVTRDLRRDRFLLSSAIAIRPCRPRASISPKPSVGANVKILMARFALSDPLNQAVRDVITPALMTHTV